MIRVGLVGAGFMGATHATCYDLLPNATLVGVADLRKELADKIASGHGCPVFPDLPGMLAALGDGIDAVDVCLPTSLHAENAVAALEAGKHCVVEKPLALSIEEGERIVDAARAANRQCMVAHVIRFWPEYQVLRRVVETNDLGSLRNGAFWRITQRRKPGTSWQEWLYDPERCGSPAMDLQIHDLDLVRRLFGDPVSHDARGSMYAGRLEHLFAQYTLPSGGVVSIESGWDYPPDFPFEMGFRCVFEEGALEFRSGSGGAKLYRRSGEQEEPEAPRPDIPDSATQGNIASVIGYYNELAYFVSRLEAGEPVEEGEAADSLVSLRIMLDVIAGMKA